jgi:hypothetical protein
VTYPLNVPTTGKYEICVWHPQGTNRTTGASFRVNHAGGTATVSVNQQRAGGRWIRLGDYDFNAGYGSVVLLDTSTASQVVMADAVKATMFPAAAADIIVDNANAGFTASANWSTGTSAADKFGSDYRFRGTAALSDVAQFSYSAPSTRNYEVFAWWAQGSNRSAAAPYHVSTTSGNVVVNRNQQTGGGTWNSLGTYGITAGTNTVKLSCWATTGFVVVADAVKISPR